MKHRGLFATIAAAVMAIATGLAIIATASEAKPAVVPLVVVGLILLMIFLVVGSARWIGSASLPMLGTIMLEAGFGDGPSWIRSIVIGCLWFATLEMSWDSIERRSGAKHTQAATARRLQEVATVISLALVIGLVASAATSFAPDRSVLLQALVLGGLLAAFVVLIRQAAVGRPQTR